MATSTLRRLKARPVSADRELELLWYRTFRALVRHGRIPGTRHGGGSVVWGLVVHVLSQGPRCVSSNERVAQALGVRKRTIITASAAASSIEIAPGVPLLRLRRDFIVVPLNGPCPWDPDSDVDWARSNKHGWALAAGELLEAVQREHSAEAAARKATRRARKLERRRAWAAARGIELAPTDHSHGCCEPASTLDLKLDGLNSASLPTLAPAEGGAAAAPPSSVASETPPDGGSARAYHRRRATDGAAERAHGVREHAAGQGAAGSGSSAPPADPDVEALAAAWNAQKFRNSNGTPSVAGVAELRTLRARLREGYSVDDLRAAIIGAAGPESWARLGKARIAFALVFARINGSLDRHIHDGRRLSAGRRSSGPDPLAQLLVDEPDDDGGGYR
jgi:hypothetical protein